MFVSGNRPTREVIWFRKSSALVGTAVKQCCIERIFDPSQSWANWLKTGDTLTFVSLGTLNSGSGSLVGSDLYTPVLLSSEHLSKIEGKSRRCSSTIKVAYCPRWAMLRPHPYCSYSELKHVFQHGCTFLSKLGNTLKLNREGCFN